MVKKEEIEVKVQPAARQRYVRLNRVDEFKKKGWKQVEITDMKIKKIIDKNQDTILMEK